MPIIDHNPRRGPRREFDPAYERRYSERSTAEHLNSLLKCHYGGRWVRMRGAVKVMCHVTFGVEALMPAIVHELALAAGMFRQTQTARNSAEL